MEIKGSVGEHIAKDVLGVGSVQTLRNWRHLRKGPPYVKLGRRVVYRMEDLLDYLERHRIDPEGQK
jgi:hypothetical protein